MARMSLITQKSVTLCRIRKMQAIPKRIFSNKNRRNEINMIPCKNLHGKFLEQYFSALTKKNQTKCKKAKKSKDQMSESESSDSDSDNTLSVINLRTLCNVRIILDVD